MKRNDIGDPILTHRDYELVHGSGWFYTDQFNIRIICSDKDVFLEVYDYETNNLIKSLTVTKEQA